MFDTIRPYITKDEPFGPIDSVDIDPRDTDVMNRLFERHNWIYKNLDQRPSIIMGRKGAVIDVLVTDEGQKHLRLNTHSDRAVNEAKARGMGSPATLEEKRDVKRSVRRKQAASKAVSVAEPEGMRES